MNLDTENNMTERVYTHNTKNVFGVNILILGVTSLVSLLEFVKILTIQMFVRFDMRQHFTMQCHMSALLYFTCRTG